LRFSQKQQDESVPIFFSGFRRKRLFITTRIEKQCTRLLMLSTSNGIYTVSLAQKWCHFVSLKTILCFWVTARVRDSGNIVSVKHIILEQVVVGSHKTLT